MNYLTVLAEAICDNYHTAPASAEEVIDRVCTINRVNGIRYKTAADLSLRPEAFDDAVADIMRLNDEADLRKVRRGRLLSPGFTALRIIEINAKYDSYCERIRRRCGYHPHRVTKAAMNAVVAHWRWSGGTVVDNNMYAEIVRKHDCLSRGRTP